MEISPLKTWSPAVYETLQTNLAQLEEGLDAPLSQLAELLDIALPVFLNVLQSPPPSEADRQKLLASTVRLGDAEYKTNNEFRLCAETVSKAVNLNELYAANLVVLSIPRAQKFDRSQAETAIYLHYSRRQYFLAALLQIVRYVADPGMDEYLRKFLLEYVTKLCVDKDGKTYPVRLLGAMKAGRDEVLQIEEKQRNTLILRDTTKVYGDEDLKVRKKLVVQEIDTLSLILHGLVRLKFVVEKDIRILLTELKNADKLDVFSINLIPPLISWLNQLCLMDDNITADTPHPALPPFDGPTLKRVQIAIVKGPEKWKSTLLGSYVQLHWLSALNGICKLEDTAAAEFTYETDILEPATAAAKQGGFDFAIKNILKPARQGTFTPAIRSEITGFLASRNLPPQCMTDPYEPVFVSQDSKDLSTYQLEHLVQLFISHLADVLKHIRLVEEDKTLAEGSLFDYSEPSVQQHNLTEERDFTLEVIFLLISQLYGNRPDSAVVFLSDADSALYGFLNWASSVKPISMLWTFLDLCASIAEGPNCAVAVDRLFSADTTDQPRSKRFHQSWQMIFDALQYYAENLRSPQAQNVGRSVVPSMADRLELEEEGTVILKAYLRLVRQVAANSHESKMTLLSRNEERVLSNIFELSVNRLATDLKVEIWSALAAFAKDDEAIVTEIWSGLDSRVEQYVERMQNQRTFFNVSLITRASTFKDTNIITLDITTPEATSAEEYAAFVQLLVNLVEVSSTDHPLHDILTFNEKLGETYRIPGIHPFVNFVMQMFPVALSSDTLDSDSKSILVSSCLEFLYQSLDSFNADLIKFANVTGVNVDKALACSSLMAYISLHPGSLIMTHLLDDKILGAILETLNIPIERLNDEPKTSPVVKSILRTLQIINSALNWQQMFIDVVEPLIRDHLQTVTGQDLHSLRHTSLKAIENRILSRVPSVQQIALFINAEEVEIALLAIQTVDRLAAFARGNVPGGVAPIEIPRRNRLLEIIRNSKDSKRILFGVLNKLENVDAEEPIAPFESNSLKQKRAVLALLRKDLVDSPEVPSIAHFLLGYHVTDGARLELGQGMGNIGSDVSVLKSVFALIDPLEDEALSATVGDRNPIETMSRDLSTSEMALEIVVRLCKANLSGAITTMALRQDAVYLQQFSTETMIFPKLLAAIELCLRDGLSAAGRSSIVSSSLRRKTWLLRYLANEMHIFAGQKAHGSLRSMTEYLIGKKSQSRGFQSLFEPESTDARTILSFFDQVIINVGSFDDLDPSRFGEAYAQVDWGSCRSEPRPGYFESDCQQVSELVLLKTQEVATPPPKDEALQAKLFEDGRNVVETFVDLNIMQEMTWANGECLEAWSELFTVILEEGLPLVDRASQEGFVNEAVRILALRFSDISFLQSPHADTLSYILFHLIQAMQDPSAISTRGGILELLDPNTDRSASFFTNIIAAIQGCSHIQSIRENLYFVIYSCITFAISYVAPPDMDAASRSTLRSRARRFDATDFLARLVQLSTANGERFVDMLCHDSLMGDGTVKVTSTLLLSVLLESDAEANLGVMGPILERRGFMRLFAPSITEARNELEEAIRTGEEYVGLMIVVETKLAVLLEVSRTRSGASQVLQSQFFDVLRGFALTPDVLVQLQKSADAPLVIARLRQLNIALQTVTGIIISLGRQNPIIGKHVPSILGTQEATLLALFEAYCSGGDDIATGTLSSSIWEIVTLVDNIKDLLGGPQDLVVSGGDNKFS